MSKAYDKVKWSFLRRFLIALGMECKWVELIMECVSLVSFIFLNNEERRGVIRPARGIHQGDSISPYLFLFCAEALSKILESVERRKEIEGLRIAKESLPITHLLFANDCLLFFEAKSAKSRAIAKSLNLFSNLKAQERNFQKSAACFSPNTSPAEADFVI